MYISTGTCYNYSSSTSLPALAGVYSDKVRCCSLIYIFLITGIFSYACLVELPGFCFLIYDALKWGPGSLSLGIPHSSVKPRLFSERPRSCTKEPHLVLRVPHRTQRESWPCFKDVPILIRREISLYSPKHQYPPP